MLRTVLAGALAVAALTGTAEATCVGTTQIGAVCAEVNRGALPKVVILGSTYDDCVEVDGVCTVPIHVPIPRVTPGSGQLVEVSCGGPTWTCAI